MNNEWMSALAYAIAPSAAMLAMSKEQTSMDTIFSEERHVEKVVADVDDISIPLTVQTACHAWYDRSLRILFVKAGVQNVWRGAIGAASPANGEGGEKELLLKCDGHADAVRRAVKFADEYYPTVDAWWAAHSEEYRQRLVKTVKDSPLADRGA